MEWLTRKHAIPMWGLLIGGLLLLGLGAAGGAGTAEQDAETPQAVDDPDPQPAETVTVTRTVTVAPTEPTPAPAPTEPEPEPEPEPTTEAPPAEDLDAYTAGSYTLTDVQVTEDSLGDFEVRARGTNNGSDKQGVCLQASFFRDGSVVGTADTCVQNWGAGETRTVEFFSTDDYQEFDSIEFQVESEF